MSRSNGYTFSEVSGGWSREVAELHAEIAADKRRQRIEAANAEYFASQALPPDARIERWLTEAPGAETEDVVDLLRDLQDAFREARERARERGAKRAEWLAGA